MVQTEFNEWLREFEGLAESSAYRYTLKIDSIGRKTGDLRRLSPLDIYEIVSELSGSKSDYNVWVSAVKKYNDYLKFIEDKDYKLADKLKYKASDKTLPKPLTENEVRTLLNQPDTSTRDGLRDRVMMELLYCGLRNSECCDIKLKNIFDKTVKVTGKGAKERLVPINNKAWNFLLDYVVLIHGSTEHKRLVNELGKEAVFRGIKNVYSDDPTRPLFFSPTGNELYPRKVRLLVTKYAERCGIEDVHPHRFRHSFASHTLDKGLGNLIALKDVLGHENLNTVMLYTKTSKSGRDLVREFHPNDN